MPFMPSYDAFGLKHPHKLDSGSVGRGDRDDRTATSQEYFSSNHAVSSFRFTPVYSVLLCSFINASCLDLTAELS